MGLFNQTEAGAEEGVFFIDQVCCFFEVDSVLVSNAFTKTNAWSQTIFSLKLTHGRETIFSSRAECSAGITSYQASLHFNINTIPQNAMYLLREQDSLDIT